MAGERLSTSPVAHSRHHQEGQVGKVMEGRPDNTKEEREDGVPQRDCEAAGRG